MDEGPSWILVCRPGGGGGGGSPSLSRGNFGNRGELTDCFLGSLTRRSGGDPSVVLENPSYSFLPKDLRTPLPDVGENTGSSDSFMTGAPGDVGGSGLWVHTDSGEGVPPSG